jgi:hypothetical protein
MAGPNGSWIDEGALQVIGRRPSTRRALHTAASLLR